MDKTVIKARRLLDSQNKQGSPKKKKKKFEALFKQSTEDYH